MTRRETSTEIRNPRTLALDESDTQEVLKLLFAEDARAVEAATRAVGDVARAVDAVLDRLELGGRVHYFGAGASGRLALADAAEIRPTFGIDERLFTAHFPGGWKAVMDSTVDLEDSADLGYQDAAELTSEDVAFGVTASGSTAYVRGAFRRSREIGALSVLLTCDPNARLRSDADICIVADTGPEALAGSTRLKAGTATKVILNAFSTALMVRSGRTYSNLMVGLRATNRKLRKRATTILMEATGRSHADCEAALHDADGKVEVALVVLRTGCSVEAAESTLGAEGSVREALQALGG
jgi:N-acetylmuramic acid 6-phosphate etherase